MILTLKFSEEINARHKLLSVMNWTTNILLFCLHKEEFGAIL